MLTPALLQQLDRLAQHGQKYDAKTLTRAEQQAYEQQATHKKSLNPCRVCDAVDAGSKD